MKVIQKIKIIFFLFLLLHAADLKWTFIIQAGDCSVVIYEKGCLRAGEEWVERNLVPVAGVAVAMAVLQVKTGLFRPKS